MYVLGDASNQSSFPLAHRKGEEEKVLSGFPTSMRDTYSFVKQLEATEYILCENRLTRKVILDTVRVEPVGLQVGRFFGREPCLEY